MIVSLSGFRPMLILIIVGAWYGFGILSIHEMKSSRESCIEDDRNKGV
jgi:hypothetical protein